MNEENSKANVLKKAIESVNKKKEQEKEAGKERGPGVPDGTGPYGGTEKCPMTKKEEQTPGMLQKNAHIMAGFITEVGGLEKVAIVEPWHQRQHRMEKGPLHPVASVMKKSKNKWTRDIGGALQSLTRPTVKY
jgi:hypothetical protein